MSAQRRTSLWIEYANTSVRTDDCPFAFRLAREEKNNRRAIYKGDGTRKWLLANDAFKKSYGRAKQRIRGMDVRWISEPDNLMQTLLEIYVAVTLRIPTTTWKPIDGGLIGFRVRILVRS